LAIFGLLGGAGPAWAASAENPPNSEPAEVRLLFLEVDYGGEADSEMARTVGELVTVELASIGGIDLLTRDDLARALDVEAQKQAMGCEDDGCLAELADALDVAYVVRGLLTTLEDDFLLTLHLFDRRVGRKIESIRAESGDLGGIRDRVRASVINLLRPIEGELSQALPAVEEPTPRGGSALFWTGVGLLSGGTILTALVVAGGFVLEDQVAQNPDAGEGIKTLLAPPMGPILLLSAGGIGVAMMGAGGILMWMGSSE
jgi:hypothetical protein